MKIISVNVGLPREILIDGHRVMTGIFKEPIEGSVQVRRLNLDGDRQADLTVHGGPYKAIYAYPAEHYTFWRDELPEMNLSFGAFGENLTTEGMVETEINIGDQFKIGEVILQVTQPRMPCYKLAAKFRRQDIIKRFLQSERSGFYFSVIEEGELGAGDSIELIHRDENKVAVRDIVRLYAADKYNMELLRRAVQLEALPEDWRDYFQERIEKINR
jgi:MOSC domain-containing protein YiiM